MYICVYSVYVSVYMGIYEYMCVYELRICAYMCVYERICWSSGHDGISDYRKEGRCLKINYDVFTQHILGLIITATKLMKDASVQPKVLMNERTADGWTCQIIIHPVSHKAAVDIR